MRAGNRAPAALLAALVLAAATLGVYWQVGSHSFILLDDNIYVTENPRVRAGLTAEGTVWAFTTFRAGNWHPLTWLSHMTDVELFGMDSGWHHRVNLAFHAANSLLLFLVLRTMTGALWRSAFVAALFAVHPLHVESVAWVSERKDLLCAFFWILTLWAYARYAARGGAGRYGAVVAFFALALLSKPMAVTLPFVLLLLDYWPLGRRASPVRLLREKAPLIAMSFLLCAVTLGAQTRGGALGLMVAAPLRLRVANAIVSYVGYLRKTIWPDSLAFFYPHPASVGQGVPAWKAAGLALCLGAVTVLAVRRATRRPYLAVGWLWYLGTLVPVIGLVQAGAQGMADRYAYLPLVGVLVACAWGIADLPGRRRVGAIALGLSAATALAALAAATRVQVSYWKADVPLYAHALAVTRDNWLARFKLGEVLERQGRESEAELQYLAALRIKPDFFHAQNNLAGILARRGKLDEAIARYRNALLLRPDDADVRYNLAVLLYQRGEPDKAAAQFREVLRMAPGDRMSAEFLRMITEGAGR